MEVKDIKEELFNELIMDSWYLSKNEKFLGKKPVVVEFYSMGCKSCGLMEKVLEKLAKKYAGVIDFYKVDAKKERHLVDYFRIKSVPTLMLFSENNAPKCVVGFRSEVDVRAVIESTFFIK